MKRDAQTGNAVPRAGFTFQLLNGDREPISQTSWHPAHTVMNTFATDETGTVTLPESLNPGTYYIRETSAKEPYLVDEDLEITIPADMNLTPVAVASFYDDAATGSIEIVKNDAVGGAPLPVLFLISVPWAISCAPTQHCCPGRRDCRHHHDRRTGICVRKSSFAGVRNRHL